jgi:hypothetical protein
MAELDHADETTPIGFLLVGQQWSDKGSLFRQEVLVSKIVRVAARAFFITVHRQYGRANGKGAGRQKHRNADAFTPET